MAAGEVLRDRLSGRAQEPQVAEEEPPTPPTPPDPYSLAFLALSLFGGLSGHMHFHVHRVDYGNDSHPDLPVPFGPKMTWLALDTRHTEAVVTALGLQGARPATWGEGIAAASQSSVLVTPPLADWTLAVGTVLFPPHRAEAFVKPLLARLSQQFGEAQYFCTHKDFELHAWARARHGRLIRGYGWLGQRDLTLWDEGAHTKEECSLAFRFVDPQSPTAISPDENGVMQLASLWSIDPTSLDREFKEPVMGVQGAIARTEG